MIARHEHESTETQRTCVVQHAARSPARLNIVADNTRQGTARTGSAREDNTRLITAAQAFLLRLGS